MKTITLLSLLFLSTAHANYISMSDLSDCSQDKPFTVYIQKETCEAQEAQTCHYYPATEAVTCHSLDLVDEQVDDHSKPQWSAKQNEVSCEDEAACEALRADHCSSLEGYEFFYAENLILPGYEAYCSKFLGYEKKLTGLKVLQKNDAKLAAYNSQKIAKANLEAALGQAKKLRECGERVMGLMLVRNQPKGLTTAQVKQLVAGYKDIKALLESGSLVSAKEEILAVNADGVLVTEADKAALAAEVDKCLGL
jgi:hypothetical protein